MYKFTENIRIRLKPFFKQYIDFADEAYNGDVLTEAAIKQSIKALCNGEIFSPYELSETILHECDVLLPKDCIAEIIKKG